MEEAREAVAVVADSLDIQIEELLAEGVDSQPECMNFPLVLQGSSGLEVASLTGLLEHMESLSAALGSLLVARSSMLALHAIVVEQSMVGFVSGLRQAEGRLSWLRA